MFCALSGEVPQEPVVSTKTGQLFEKRLVSKHIAGGGKCPLTGEDLYESDLIAVKASTTLRPRSITGNSIPAMISNFQNEWDEVMLETFQLKQHLDATRKELSQALYQHDAACRVIARLIKERDEARAQLLEQTQNGNAIRQPVAAAAAGPSEESMDVASSEVEGLGAEITSALSSKCDELSAARKARKGLTFPGLATKENLVAMGDAIASGGKGKNSSELVKSFAPHKTDKPGVTCLALSGDGTNCQFTLSGGMDKTAIVAEYGSGAVVGKITGHTKKVTAVAFHPAYTSSGLVYTGSADSTVKQWKASDDSSRASFSELFTYKHHKKDVTAFSVHPTGSYAVSTSLDGSWAFLDLNRGEMVKQLTVADAGITCGMFHPDGLILGVGCENHVVKIYDVREQSHVSTFESHDAPVSCCAFSENGYICASGSADGTVKIWDLRKLNVVKKTLEMPQNSPVNSLEFDYSASYLAIATGNGVRIHATGKDWSEVTSISCHSKATTGVAWGNRQATELASCAMDRTIKMYSCPTEK